MKIRLAKPADAKEWFRLRRQLWPSHITHQEDIAAFFAGKSHEPVVVFFAERENGALCGFAEVSIRRDYVEGTTSSPVPYLEGWFVELKFRGQHIGKNLLAFAEAWAVSSGYTEFGSDTAIDNKASIQAHLACGFRVADTAVHLIKHLDTSTINLASHESQ